MESLRNKRVTVMGLGLHGGALGTIEWLESQGAQLTVTDLKSEAELKSTLKKLKKYSDITFVLGKHREQDFAEADLIIRNPAVPRTSKFLQIAYERNVPVEMDSGLFFRYSPSKNIIGVTGSKGKTTTANAIATVFKAYEPKTVAVGIDGVSPLGELKNVQKGSPVIFELSSWRLEDMAQKKVSPATAVVTSIYRDHLNTYESFEEYIETKKHIIRWQKKDDVVLLNGDDPLLRQWETEVIGQLFWYSTGDIGSSNGIFVRNNQIRIRLPHREERVLLAWDKLPLQAEHQRRNLLPALLIAALQSIPETIASKAIAALEPLPHRLETVRVLNGITFINDSTATMPDATIAALSALHDKTIVPILGGSDKKLLFEQLAESLASASVRALVFLPGSATAALEQAVRRRFKLVPDIYETSSMAEAVEKAFQAAKPGDVILLSPGATSFGLFQHEFDRGNQFRDVVHQL